MYNATKSNYLSTEWIKAEGWLVTDIKNNKYIDFTSAIFTANCGHGAVAEAIKEQAQKVIHCYTFDTPIRNKFISKLKSFLPDFCEKIYLASAGSEVTSWAVKAMRTYTKKNIIVHIEGAFHGKVGDAAKLEDESLSIDHEVWDETYMNTWIDKVGGIMIETYEGWSAKFHDKNFIQNLVSWAQKNDIPVCFDEIQSGFYRTGKKFGYEYYEVIPDLLCLGKSLGGGMPLSALVGREKYFTFDDMSSTHAGHPVCCAAGVKALEIYENLDQKVLDTKALILDSNLKSLCQNYPNIFTSYESTGLLAAIMCKSKELADEITKKAESRGVLLVNTGKKSIKIGPPLIISSVALNRGLNLLKYSVEEISKC